MLSKNRTHHFVDDFIHAKRFPLLPINAKFNFNEFITDHSTSPDGMPFHNENFSPQTHRFGVCPFYLLNWSLLNTHVFIEWDPICIKWSLIPKQLLDLLHISQWFMLTPHISTQQHISPDCLPNLHYVNVCIYRFNVSVNWPLIKRFSAGDAIRDTKTLVPTYIVFKSHTNISSRWFWNYYYNLKVAILFCNWCFSLKESIFELDIIMPLLNQVFAMYYFVYFCMRKVD